MIRINLTNPAKTQEILLEDYHQELPLKRSFLGFNKTGKWTLNIKIVDLEYDGLIINDPSKLIKLKINDKEGANLTLDIDSRNLYFSSLIDTGEILDCNEIEDSSNSNKLYHIKYGIEYSVISSKKPQTFRRLSDSNGVNVIFSHEIAFDHITQTPKLHFADFAPVFSAVNNESVVCGQIDLCLQHLYRRAPFLNMEFSLSVIENTMGGEVNRTDIVRISEECITETDMFAYNGSMNLHPEGTSNSALEFESLPVTKQYQIKHFYVNGDHHVILPVLFDMNQISNPRTACDTYTLVMKGHMWSGDAENQKVEFREEFPITVMRNNKETDLEVAIFVPTALAEPEIHPMAKVNGNQHSVHRVDEVYVNGGTRRDFNLVVRNTAEAESNPNAAVRIKSFRISGPSFEDGVTVLYEDGFERAFEIIGGDLLDYPETLTNLRFGENDITLIRYVKDSIKGFRKTGENCFETEAVFKFSFLYLVDKNGSKLNPTDGDFERFSGSIVIPLSVAPAPEWMCVDFGTSAVVAEYGKSVYDDQGNIADNLLNLRAEKIALMKKAFTEKEKEKRIDRNESNTEFISSMSAFNSMARLGDYNHIPEKTEFKDATIWFSPSTSMIDPSYQLPCLKSLMGYDTLPKGIFPYEFEKDLIGKPISKINVIYQAIYSQLFKFYVPDGIEKLILSIPNTFAPIHLKLLRELALNNIPTLRNSRIRFVSESDAVAYYYLSRRNNIMNSGDIAAKDRSKIDENTLVYDMGAGTLDITYFSKNETPQCTEIEIRGKMGVNKAGNYIDYLIGEIIADLIKETKFGKRITQFLELNRDKRDASITNQNCNEFKAYVRDKVKPALNTPDSELERCSLDSDNTLSGLKGNDILSHEKFKYFLSEITNGVFESFVQLFGNSGKMPLDLVIFSGRSTSLQVIRDAIIDSIGKFNSKQECRFVDIAAEKFISKGETVDINAIKGLKSVVAAGALAYPTIIVKDDSAQNRAYTVRNRNVYATYGIMAHTAKGWQWYPLINAKTRPTTSPKSVHGMDICCYDSSRYSVAGDSKVLRLPLGNIDSMYVLQSYSVDTKRDWENNNKDMITILCCKNLANYTQEENVALKITEDNEIVLWIGASPTEMYAHDDFYNVSLRKSMWPVIFSENNNKA